MKKKIFALTMAAAMTLGLAACGSTGASSASGSAPASSASGKTYTIGICQLVQHPALDAATKGFRDALTEKLGTSSPLTSRTPPAIPLPALPSATASSPAMWT